MKYRRFSHLILFLEVFSLNLLVSCTSLKIQPFSFDKVSNLSEIYGSWTSKEGVYTFPFIWEGKKYLRYSWSSSDDTLLWQRFASSRNMKLEDLWKKRFAFASQIYSRGFIKETLPDSDINGIQTGRKFYLINNKIYSSYQILIPERLVMANLSYFLLNEKAGLMKENMNFYLASDKFPDLEADGRIYYKLEEKDE